MASSILTHVLPRHRRDRALSPLLLTFTRHMWLISVLVEADMCP